MSSALVDKDWEESPLDHGFANREGDKGSGRPNHSSWETRHVLLRSEYKVLTFKMTEVERFQSALNSETWSRSEVGNTCFYVL